MNSTYMENNGINAWMLMLEFFFGVFFLVFIAVMLWYDRRNEKNEKSFEKKKHYKLRLYLYALVSAIAFLVLSDVIVIYFYEKAGYIVYLIELIFNCIYFLSNYTALWLVMKYTLELIVQNGGAYKKVYQYINSAIYGMEICIILINVVYPFVFRIGEDNMYYRCGGFVIALVPAYTTMVLLVTMLVKYRKNLSGYEHLTILSYIIFPVVAEGFQIVDAGFSWQPMAMAFSAVIIIVQNIIMTEHRNSLVMHKNIERAGKELQTRIILFVCVIIIVFFGLMARIAIGFASIQMDREIEAHYQMLANKTTEQASAWIVKETQILLNQKASLEIINNFDHDFLTEYLTHIVEEYNYDHYVYDIYFVNTKNQMSSGSGYVQDPSIDFRQRDWYEGALSSDNMCYTVPYVDVDTQKYVVTVSIKVFDRNRKFMGVLALDIFVDKLFSITEQQSLPRDSYLFIVDNEMELVTHPNEAYGYVNESPQKIENIENSDYLLIQKFIEKGLSENNYITIKDFDGKNRCFFVSKVEDCDWYVVAAISKNVIDESRSNLSKSIFVSLIICLVLGIILTLWATNNIIRKLTEAQEEAKAASEAKSRFLANMSHEIRTPINAVLGMDEILLRECKDDNIKEYALNIQSAGQALLGVVNDILDFSKIESDRLDLVPGNYNFGELISSCVNLIQVRVQEKSLKLQVERDEYLPKTLYGDVVRIRQIISNLLTNAVKYTKEGSITFIVGWKKTDEEQGELVIRVKDTGIGIKKENIKDLFNSFQRLDEKKNRNIEGTGLGLTITKQLVELMGGQIVVESEYGKGSEFIVTIPQKVVDASNTVEFGSEKDKSDKKSQEKTAQQGLKTKGARILVVDDVSMNLKVVKGLLKGTDLEIDTAERGQEAIEMMKENVYDIVFLDHMMPELDGVETLRIIKKDYPNIYQSTPIIMLTANAVLGVEEEYRSEGFAGYLSKPIQRDLLIKMIAEKLPDEKIVAE